MFPCRTVVSPLKCGDTAAFGREGPYPGLGCGPVLCQCAGQALISISRRAQHAHGMREDIHTGPVGRQVQTNATGVTCDHGRDLEQPLDEHIAKCGQQNAQLVGAHDVFVVRVLRQGFEDELPLLVS